MNLIFFDGHQRNDLLPLTFTRPTADLRVGILKIWEKWQKRLPESQVSFWTEAYLSEKFKLNTSSDNYLINGSLLPDNKIVSIIQNLKIGQVLVKNNVVWAARCSADFEFATLDFSIFEQVEFSYNVSSISYPWDIFRLNGQEIEADFKLITNGRTSQPLSDTNRFRQADRIFLEPGAKVEFAILNPDNGYIYIGEDAEIMEGAVVRGSLAMCEHSALKMSAKIYGPTTVGPHSKVGGEVNNSVIYGYSNKAHDGFLGNSVLGEWCNLGADTNNSNLKNNYEEVKVWNYQSGGFKRTGLQFCGLIMGDHSKAGINTMFNTGTVVGVSSNIFGSGFPRNFVPSFSWGGASGFETYKTSKAFQTAKLVMSRRNIDFDATEQKILETVFALTEQYRAK